MLPNQAKGRRDESAAQTQVLRQRDGRLKPKLGLPFCVKRVNMHSSLLPREEEKPETARPEDRWTHGPVQRKILMSTGVLSPNVPALYAARKGASSFRVIAAQPRLPNTRFRAVNDTRWGAVNSIPIGFPVRV